MNEKKTNYFVGFFLYSKSIIQRILFKIDIESSLKRRNKYKPISLEERLNVSSNAKNILEVSLIYF